MQATLDRYAAGASDQLGFAISCSLMLRTGSAIDQVASNDPSAAACDQVEAREGAGPCISAIEQLSSILIEDLDAEDRWPQWQEAARSSGFRSFIALPGYVDERTTVALNVYSREPDAWHRDRIVGLDQYVQELAAMLHAATS
ncbi:GAF domain-containing protein [Cellulomonas sp. Marseille-Q8402]